MEFCLTSTRIVLTYLVIGASVRAFRWPLHAWIETSCEFIGILRVYTHAKFRGDSRRGDSQGCKESSDGDFHDGEKRQAWSSGTNVDSNKIELWEILVKNYEFDRTTLEVSTSWHQNSSLLVESSTCIFSGQQKAIFRVSRNIIIGSTQIFLSTYR